MPLLPEIRRDGTASIAAQVVAHFRTAIENGSYRAGERLPTIRAVAEQASVTRATVQLAYRRLAELGLVEGTVGRGTVVTAQAEADARGSFGARAEAAWRHLATMVVPTVPDGVELVASFANLWPDEAHVPAREFGASLERVLEDRGSKLLLYDGHAGGSTELRALLASRGEAADPPASPDEILITSGAQQGLDLVLRAFTEPGDGVAVPLPSYHHMFGMLKAHGLQLVPVATREQGLDLADLQRALARGARLLYVMPTFHNPTGVTLDERARRALCDVLRKTTVPVLEDEFQRELRFTGKPLPSLAHLDSRGLTVTARTFSKGLFPGVRLGWLQASAEVVQRLSALKRFVDLESSGLLQAALADFIGRGNFDRHLGLVRTELRARHEAAQRALERAMPKGMRWTRPEGGYLLWLETPGLDADALAAAAAARGVLTTPGRLFDPRARASAGLRLSLSRHGPETIERGLEVLGACAGELLRSGTRTAARPLFL